MTRKTFTVVNGEPRKLDLPEQDAALFHEMVDAYRKKRLGSQGHREKSVNRDTSVINNFIMFVQKAPWYCAEEDFERWCYQIGVVQNQAAQTQRHAHGVIEGFYRYIVANVRFFSEIERIYGIRMRQIVHDDNRIPHVEERELKNERPAFTHVQVDMFFDSIEKMIRTAAISRSKSLLPLLRDKAMFATLYTLGLRIGACHYLNVDSFEPNPRIPELGDYGFARARKKGSKGSGDRFYIVPVDHAMLPPLLKWYANEIRPQFMLKADPNERAMFLSERGNRIRIQSMEERFHRILDYAGLEGLGLTPHSFRHSMVTHSQQRGNTLEYARLKAGHLYGTTTQLYTHLPDTFIRDELESTVTSQIDRAMEDEKPAKQEGKDEKD